MDIYALHGFLGQPSDWDTIKKEYREHFHALDLFSFTNPNDGLEQWAYAFNQWIAKQGQHKRILLGYSLGGRLAMHALINEPQLWSGAIIVSANTGLKIQKQRAPRFEQDLQWAQRFLHDPWEKVINDWNTQAVFQGKAPSFNRREKEYVRTTIASAIVGWSVGQQDDLQETLSQLPFPILWIAGEKDHKYAALAQQMAKIHPASSFWIAPEAGHRVPWEATESFIKTLHRWIQRLDM